MATEITAYIGASKIKLCEIQTSSKGATIRKASVLRTPEGYVDDGRLIDIEGLAQIILKEFALQGIMAKGNITFAVQSSKIAYKEVLIPSTIKEAKLIDFINANASDYFPINLEEYSISGRIIAKVSTQEAGEQLRVGVYAAPKDVVNDYYDLADRLGFAVKNIESYNNATMSLLSKQMGPEPSVVIQVFDDSTTVSVFKDTFMEFQRTVPYGKNLVLNAVMDYKRINKTEADRLLTTDKLIRNAFDGDVITESLRPMVTNVAKVIEYYNSRNAEAQVEKAYLTGESVGMNGLDALIEHEFDFKVINLTEFNGVTLSPRLYIEKRMVAIYIANIGAVIKPINFRTERASRSNKVDNSLSYLKIGLFVAAAAAVVMVGWPLFQKIMLKVEISDYEEKINKVKDIEIVVDDYYKSKDKASDAEKFVALTEGKNDYLVEFIKAMEKGMPSDVSIKSMSVNNGNVTISAVTSTKQTIAKFLTQLNNMPGVSGVFVASTAEAKDSYGIVKSTFNIVISFDSQIKEYLSSAVLDDQNTEVEAE